MLGSCLRCPFRIILNSETAIIYTSAHLQPDLQSAALITIRQRTMRPMRLLLLILIVSLPPRGSHPSL